jgi:hypothetical protein
MAAIYELIGRAFVRHTIARYRRRIRAAVAVGIVAIVAGGYLAASREPPEG